MRRKYSVFAGIAALALVVAGCCGGGRCISKPEAGCPGGVCGKHVTSQKQAAEPAIDTAGLKTLLDSKVPVVVLDARSGKFDDGKRIPGALSLAAGAPAEEVAKLIPSKDSLLVTYCSNLQCPASAKLAAHLHGLGYVNILEYPQGIAGWVEAGHPVVDAAK